MKWKKKIWVIDDVIPVVEQEKIKRVLIGDDTTDSVFPWHFVDDVTGGGSRDKRPAFSHTFVREGEIKSHQAYIKMLEPLWKNSLEKIKEKTQSTANYSAVAARTFLQLPLNGVKGGEYDAHHIDRLEEHFAVLYYVCDADGETVIFDNMYSKNHPQPPQPYQLKEKKRVKPKQGRVVIFDGYYWHTATQPSKHVRCVINTDIIQQASS